MIALVLLGCGMDEDRFQREADAAVCAWREDCLGDDASLCESAAEAQWTGGPDGCSFEESEAKACVDGLERLSCPDTEGTAFPDACDRVWECPG